MQSNFRLSIHKIVQNYSQRFAQMLFRMQHFRVQYFVTIIFALQCRSFVYLNTIFHHKTALVLFIDYQSLFYFMKLTSISADAFTDSKFKFFFIYDQASGKDSILSLSDVN